MNRPPCSLGKARTRLLSFLGIALGTSLAHAAPPVQAPAGPGQKVLGVGVFDGQVRARLCPSAACDPSQGSPVAVPAEAQGLLENATLELVNLGQGRHVVHLTAPDEKLGRAYELVISAPLTGTAPLVVFSDFTGLVSGQEGSREGPMVYVSDPTPNGERRVVIGKQYEAISICGRPTVLAPQLLNPADLVLRAAKVQRLPPSERDRAPRLKAERLADATPLGPSVLRAVGASSGVGAPQNLTDGDTATTWAENRGGDGKGEFVTLNAPPQLPVSGFDFVIRPETGEPPPEAGSAREFWLATKDRLFHVSMPEDAWQAPGARYRVTLGEPLKTDCVALVLESGWGNRAQEQVTFAEMTAMSEFDPRDVEGLVGALAGGGERAEAAKSVLMSGGPVAFRAVEQAFKKLDEGGRRVALEVMDQASCELATPTYVRALLGRYKAHAIHAMERLRRCGRKSAEHLVKTLRVADPRAWAILANELGLIAPELAVREIAPLLNDGSGTRRRMLRVAFARAAADAGARAEIEQLLADPSLSLNVRLEVLRSLGSAAGAFGAANRAFSALVAEHDFRTRYLLLQPAAALAQNHAPAKEYLRRALVSDKDEHMRLGAALAAGGVASFTSELVGATRDPAVRVRHAAVLALGYKRNEQAAAAFSERLESDRWPMVRGAAAAALGGLQPNTTGNDALGRALDDSSPLVRREVAVALGQRKAVSFAADLRDHLGDDKEDPGVRSAAAGALGRMCDGEALDLLTELAQKRADPLLDQGQKSLSMAALDALGALGPKDLKSRLTPLMHRDAAPGARAAAERVLDAAPRCPRR